ncbi:DUF1761 domain-containing protein [Aurantiacibacter aquimixticola]|uniref:DUF1761 domain-containing protein n=1 Tax=Aurantiacibacter aquimixticola TaxID=1958945 RepID=A0A419RTP2_9SPHN|nr:DUF1761 domain-containing protein [Aurantiacibacter aquimixticola]RJY09155.1 DUF1761 domain-containing protein [Aurantiacibacter aquimixticola]
MGETNMLAVLLGTTAFFAIGALWYGPLFGKPWQRLTGITMGDDGEVVTDGSAPRTRNPVWLIMLLCFAFEMLVVLTLGHLVAATQPSDRAIMMMAVGLGAAVMAPALGINYLYQMRPAKLFAIDAGYFVTGMAAAGGVFVAMT